MPEARSLGTNTTGYKPTQTTSNGLYQPKEYQPKSFSYEPKQLGYTTKSYDINDAKMYDTKVTDPFKQKVYTYDTVREYDHYYTYGQSQPKPKPKPKRKKTPTPPPPKTPAVKKEKIEEDLFPPGYRQSTVGMVKRTLKLSKNNKVNPQMTPLPGW